MPLYEYTALDTRGRRQHGREEGEGPRQVRERLRSRGLLPLELVPVAGPEDRDGRRRGAVPRGEIALFIRQLASLLASGMPLDEALQALSEQAGHRGLRQTVTVLRDQIREGHSLHEAMEQLPRVFDRLTRAMVAAGEHSRNLPQVLERLADHAEVQQALRRRVLVALIYPAILVLVSLLVTAGLLIFVVPEVTRVFDQSGATLPLVTRTLLAASSLLREQWQWLAVLPAALAGAASLLLRQEQWRCRLQSLLLRLPLLGRLLRELEATRLARTLGGLVESGVPLLEAMQIAATTQELLPLRAAVEQARERVREGTPLHRSLGRSGLLPPMMVHLIANGERAGALPRMLLAAAGGLERSVESRIALLLGLLEPFIILIMGALVMFIVIAILLPIFDMNTLV